FLGSETDIAFLNSFGMRAAFDGVDLFPPREAAFIRSMAPSRIRVLGTVDPPDGASAIESLIYQCETIKIDGLKLYPPGPDARGWVLDDDLHATALAAAVMPRWMVFSYPLTTARFLDLLAGSGIMDASFFTLSKRKGLPHLSGSRPRDRRFHVEGNQGPAVLANSGLDTSPDNKPRARSASIS